MKKLYQFLLLAVFSATGAYGQNSAICFAQIQSSSSGNKCFGDCNGTALCSPTAGTAPYTYSWSPGGYTTQGITGLCAGNYTVMVTDFVGSTCSNSVAITAPVAISCTVTTTSVSCSGGNNGTASASASGGTGTKTYSWAPFGGSNATATGLVAGNYTVTVTDGNGCTSVQTGAINEPAALTVSVSTAGSTATANPSGGSPPYSYMWSPGGQTGQTATSLSNGTYTVTVTDNNGCTKTASTSITLSMNELRLGTNLFIHPNPSKGRIILEIGDYDNENNAIISVANIIGERVMEEQIYIRRNLKTTMDISGFADGIYFIIISTPEYEMKWRVVKE